MVITEVHRDERGSIHSYSINGREHILVFFNKGFKRGGHYHHEDQWHIVLAGKLRVEYHDMDTGQEHEEILQEGESRLIKKNVAHLFTALEESVIAESHLPKAQTTNYPPYRNQI